MTKPLGTSQPLGDVFSPKFSHLENEVLIPDGVERTRRRPNQSMLSQFCTIAVSPNVSRSVQAFAKRWGLLQLCIHGLPTTGHHECRPHDTIDGYWKFAGCLSSLCNLGRSLAIGTCGELNDWKYAHSGLTDERFDESRTFMKHVTLARTTFQGLIRMLVEVSGVIPRLHWDQKSRTWAIDFDTFHGSNLPAILTMQLIARVGRATLRQCRECPAWFEPQGRQVYCAQCGTRAAWRAASQRFRDKRTKGPDFGGNFGYKVEKTKTNGG